MNGTIDNTTSDWLYWPDPNTFQPYLDTPWGDSNAWGEIKTGEQIAAELARKRAIEILLERHEEEFDIILDAILVAMELKDTKGAGFEIP